MAELFLIPGTQGETSKHVILIHGLGGHPYNTWGSVLNPEEFWPKWLTEDIQGLAVWTVSYTAPISRLSRSAMHLTDQATTVLERILLEPKLQTGEISLIGHSLGGLIIKQLLRTAESMAHHRHNADNFLKRVRRVAFLATPHSGSEHATWGDRFRILIQPSAATTCLVRNDPNLRELNQWYREFVNKKSIEHLILTENQPIRILGLIVTPDSSDPGLLTRPITITADHFTISKPKDRTSEIYLHLHDLITRQLDTTSQDFSIQDNLTTQFSILEQLRDTVVSSHQKQPVKLIDSEINRCLSTMRRARFFHGFSVTEHSMRLSEKIRNGDFQSGTDRVRCIALAWCARLLAPGNDTVQSQELLNTARLLGNASEIIVAESFILSQNGNLEGALNKLSGLESSNAKSAAFIIKLHHSNPDAALEWLSKSGITYSDLDADGKFFSLVQLLETGSWDTALEYANQIQEDDYQEAPALLHFSAMAHLLQAVPDELKPTILHQVPLDAKNFPLSSNQNSLRELKLAQEMFSKCALAASELGCDKAANVTDDYALFLELRDPKSFESGLEKLRLSMRESAHSLRRLHFALHFGLKLDFNAVEREIDQQSALSGGTSSDAAIARFSLALTQSSPKAVADYIDRHRDQLLNNFEKHLLCSLQIEMLAKGGFPQRAEKILTNLIKDKISEAEVNSLRRIIAESTGSDPIEARKAQFESSDQLSDLVNLVSQLSQQEDLPQLCHYSSLLFERTNSLVDAERLAGALNKSRRFYDLSKLLRQYPELLDQSDTLLMLWGWSLYREGLLMESSATLDTLRDKRDHPNDRDLAVNIAIYSGDWESLLPFVESEWANREKREPDDLIRTASLAQYAGSPRAKELVYYAAGKDANNANILVSAYSLATSAGWEDEELVINWLNDAAKLSNEDGPIQKMSLKDILERTPEWNRRENETLKKLCDGSLPIFGAAHLLNRSLIDMFLLPALANHSENDPRRRAAIPAYSGDRQSLPCNYQVVALEATSLLTLGSLGLLEYIGDMFKTIVIPHYTLAWLFDEMQKVSFHQPSKIKDASILRGLLATGSLNPTIESTAIDANLSSEVGRSLASLISETQVICNGDEIQKVVIRSSPVHNIGSLMEEEADLSSYSSHICSCLALVEKLKQKGQLTTSEDRRARSYLSLHEKKWPSQPEILDGAELYLDDLSVTYLQHIGLLDKLKPAGLKAYVSTEKVEEINTLLRYEQLTSEANKTIEAIRKFLADAIRAEKVTVGEASQSSDDDASSLGNHPTFAIYNLAKNVDAIVVDDRFLNQHQNVDHGSGLTPILTTLDLIRTLQENGSIDTNQMFGYYTRLRRATYLFIPVTNEELEHHLSTTSVVNGRLSESAELKTIRQNIQSIRMNSFLKLPKEALWYESLIQTITHTLKSQWKPDIDETTARARSEWLLELIDIRGWAHCYTETGNENVAVTGRSAQVLSLLLAPSNISNMTKERYWRWIDEHLLETIKRSEPDIYLRITNRIQELISHAAEADLPKEDS